MINREMQNVEVITFVSAADTLGQMRQVVASTRTVQMVIKQYNASNIANPKYVDITTIGITKDDSISISDQVQFNGGKYNVLFVIPSGKYTQLFMQRV